MIYARLPLVCILYLSLAAPLAAKWNYFRSPNFELYSDGAKGNAKDVLNHLEQVRDLFARISNADVAADRPVRVVAFNSEAGFKKLRRRGESAYAFYFQTRERNYIVFQELDSDRMYEVAVHEYVHLRARETGLALPMWLSEGMAELYSTMQPRGSTVRVGSEPAIVRGRGVGNWLPLKELLTASRGDSKLAKNRAKILGLYAKSWALTSMVTMHEDYRDRFSEFLLAIVAGESGEDVFQEVYGKTVKDVEKELSFYVRSATLPIMVYETKWDRQKQTLEPTAVSDIDGSLMQADLLRLMGKRDLARKEYESVLEEAPDNADAQGGLARVEGDKEQALTLFTQAVESGSNDPFLHLDYARALMRSEDASHEAIVDVLAKASELGPELVDPHILMAAYAKRNDDHAKEMLYLRRAKGVEAAARYPRYVWMSKVAADQGSQMQARLAADQAAAHARTEKQVHEVQALRRAAGGDNDLAPFEKIDAWVEAGDLEPAAAELVELQKTFSNAIPIYERFAKIQRLRGDSENADATAAAAVRYRRGAVFEGKRDAPEIYRRISLLDAAGLYEESQLFFDSLTELDPDEWILFNNRAYSLAQLDALPEVAVELAERAAELRDSNSVRDTLAWAYLKAGRTDEAVEIFARLVEEEGDDSVIYLFHYGTALAQAERKQEAVEQFDRALRDKKISEAFRKTIEEARAKAAGS